MPKPYSSKDQINYIKGLGELTRKYRILEGKDPETGYPRVKYPMPI